MCSLVLGLPPPTGSIVLPVGGGSLGTRLAHVYNYVVLCDIFHQYASAVLGFTTPDGDVGPQQLTLLESGEEYSITISFIKGAFDFYYYQMYVSITEGTASK